MADTQCRAGIAIVEDERALVKIYVKLFERRGIAICFIAYDGREALQKYIESTPKPHVILMDYRLPTLSGIEVMKEVLKIDPDARFIFLSADVSVKEKALAAGALVFLKKPASIREIDGAIEKVAKDIKSVESQRP